jgi:transposase
MSQQKRTYSNEFKQDAVELWKSSGRSAAEIVLDLGITHGLLTKWKSRANSSGQAAFPGRGHQTAEQAEIRRLQRENERLRQERDILKKQSPSPRLSSVQASRNQANEIPIHREPPS